MAGLPEMKDETMVDAGVIEVVGADMGSGVATPVLEAAVVGGKAGLQGAGGKKGKKKGKK